MNRINLDYEEPSYDDLRSIVINILSGCCTEAELDAAIDELRQQRKDEWLKDNKLPEDYLLGVCFEPKLGKSLNRMAGKPDLKLKDEVLDELVEKSIVRELNSNGEKEAYLTALDDVGVEAEELTPAAIEILKQRKPVISWQTKQSI